MIPAERRRYWVIGTALAAVGVVMARLLAKEVSGDAQGWVRTLGVVLALGGLFVIMLGTRRRA